MAPNRLALIANSHAGSRKAAEVLARARRELWGYETDPILPRSAEELSKICETLSPKTHRAAVVIGGDGTINLALQGLWRRTDGAASIPLYAFPGGTANDLAAELGIRPSFSQLQRLVDDRRPARMDVITCNGIPFATVAGIGLGATLTQAVNDTRRDSKIFCSLMRTLKAEVYTVMSAKTILTRRSFLHQVEIRSDAFSERLRIAALFVCNQDHLGGDLKVGRNNRNSDGIFSVLVVPAGGPLHLLQTLLELKSGRMPEDMITFTTRHLSIRSLENREIPVFGDGEVLLRSKALEFEIHPESLTVFREEEFRP
jgi:diacylglycerol kinase family enzyme